MRPNPTWGQFPWSLPTVFSCLFLKAISADVLFLLLLTPILSSHRVQVFPLFQSILRHVPLCGICNGSPIVFLLETLSGVISLTKQDSLESRGAQQEGSPQALHSWKSSTPVGSRQLSRLKCILTFTSKSMISPVFKTQRGKPQQTTDEFICSFQKLNAPVKQALLYVWSNLKNFVMKLS